MTKIWGFSAFVRPSVGLHRSIDRIARPHQTTFSVRPAGQTSFCETLAVMLWLSEANPPSVRKLPSCQSHKTVLMLKLPSSLRSSSMVPPTKKKKNGTMYARGMHAVLLRFERVPLSEARSSWSAAGCCQVLVLCPEGGLNKGRQQSRPASKRKIYGIELIPYR